MAWFIQSSKLYLREREYFIMKKVLLVLGLVFSMLTVCAEENVLQSIEIVPVKDTYNIVLTADKSVDVKKTVQADNKITLNMKGIRASKTLNTVYNNVSNVDTVMVEDTGNGVSVFFQAENAQGASVSFDSIAPIMPSKTEASKQQIKLSSPINTYAPIYREEAAQSKTSDLFNKLTSKASSMAPELEDSVDSAKDGLHNVFSYGLLGLLGFAVIRLFKRKEPEMKIGLSQCLNEREIDMYKGASPIQAGYTNTEKPFTTVNYGLNAYKKENQNPYETETMPIHNPRLQQYVSPLLRNQMARSAAMQQPLPEQQSVATMTAPAPQPIKKHTTPVNTAPVNQGNPNIDNLKFLESMTAIYEKSGRHDLAQGLKASLSKNSISA